MIFLIIKVCKIISFFEKAAEPTKWAGEIGQSTGDNS